MPQFLAIDADASGLAVVAGTPKGSGVRLDKAAYRTDDPQPLSPATAKALGAKLKETLKQAGIAPGPALVCVGRDRVIFKEIRHPPTAPADEPAVVRYQAIKELSDAADEGVIDYSPLPGADTAAGDRRAAVAFLRREMLAAAKVMCEAAGLKLAAVTPRPFAAAAAVQRAVANGEVPGPDALDSPVGVLTLTDAGGEFTVVRNGLVRFARTISGPSLASETALVGEVKRNLTVYAGQSGGDEVEAVYLAEGSSVGPGWAGRLAAALPVPVHPFDPAADVDSVPAGLRGRLTAAVGLLALRAKSSALPINFVQPRQPRADTGGRNRKVLFGVLGGVLLLAGAAVCYVLLTNAEAQVQAMARQLADSDARLKQEEPNVKRLLAADEFMDREVVWLDELYEMSARFPDIDKMKITGFKATAIPMKSEKEREKERATPRPKGAPPPAVARLEVTVAAPDGTLPDLLVNAMRERYYLNVRKDVLPAFAGATNLQQFIIKADVAHRPPTEYTQRLKVSAPIPADPPKPAPDTPKPDAGDGDDQP